MQLAGCCRVCCSFEAFRLPLTMRNCRKLPTKGPPINLYQVVTVCRASLELQIFRSLSFRLVRAHRLFARPYCCKGQKNKCARSMVLEPVMLLAMRLFVTRVPPCLLSNSKACLACSTGAPSKGLLIRTVMAPSQASYHEGNAGHQVLPTTNTLALVE